MSLQVWKIDSIRWGWARGGARWGVVVGAGSDDRGVEFGGEPLELAAGVAFVADHEQVAGALAALQQGEADVAFGGLGRGRRRRARGVP